jgi:hypothetical protein
VQIVRYVRPSSGGKTQVLIIRHLGPIEEVESAHPELKELLRELREKVRPREAGLRVGPNTRQPSVQGRTVQNDSVGPFELGVLSLVYESGRSGTRTKLGRLATVRGLTPESDFPPLIDQVGKALTHLHAAMLLKRRGKGGVAHPFRYECSDAAIQLLRARI